MEPGLFTMLDASTRTALLNAARQSIVHRLSGHKYTFMNNSPESILQELMGTFVTLKRHGVLRGCIGTLEPKRPLIDDVIANARAAAFEDPRFPALTAPELESLHIEISVLTTSEPIVARNRAELLMVLKPHEDGLIVQEGKRRATFLPTVWTSLPDPGDFYDALMKKAELGIEYWSSNIRFYRYSAESFGQEI